MVLTRACRDYCSFYSQLPVSRCNILHLSRPMSKLCTSPLFSISLAEFYSSNNLKITINFENSENKQLNDHNLTEFNKFNSASVFRTSCGFEFLLSVLILIECLFTKECHWMKIVKVSQISDVDNLPKVGAVAAAVPTPFFPKMPLTRRCHLPPMAGMVG